MVSGAFHPVSASLSSEPLGVTASPVDGCLYGFGGFAWPLLCLRLLLLPFPLPMSLLFLLDFPLPCLQGIFADKDI